MKSLSLNTDPIFNERDDYNAWERFWLKLINDKKDLPFINVTLKITVFMIIPGIILFLPFIEGWLWVLFAVLYFHLNNFVFKGPFGLMLHCTSHRPFFKKKYRWMNFYLPWIVGPFFGQTPETYYVHHLGMHHRENNLKDDLSSTMEYQRDSFGDFMKYFADFFFLTVTKLSIYFHSKELRKLRNRLVRGELSFYVLCIVLGFINLKATLFVFVLPFVISRFIMMLGNWAQHSFVDWKDPGNPYKNSITCINTHYNHKCWNDGYHISHHIVPSMHYTGHPDYFRNSLNEYSDNRALVFDSINFMHVWWYLMRRNYSKLAQHVVNINGMFESDSDAIALMKERTQKLKDSRPLVLAGV